MNQGQSTDRRSADYGFGDEELLAQPLIYARGLFAGQRVLVSGSGAGLGQATAVLFARLGATVILCARNRDKLEHTAELIQRVGGSSRVHTLNIREPVAVAELMRVLDAEHGGLDVLVNNAGGQFPQPALDFSVKGWKAVVDTNLNGTWYMMQNAARHWVDRGEPGCIVNVIADFWRGLPGVAHTCAARAGVAFLSKSVAVEWAPHRIRVNCVAPGCIDTAAITGYPPEGLATFPEANPMRRIGDAQDVAEAVCYLAAPSGKFITGEVLTVDGGQQLWGDLWATGRPDYFRV